MSDYLNGLARRARLGNPYRKLLLLFLTDRADDQTGITAPASISYIAFGTELSETTVKKYRKELGPADGSEEEEDVRLGLISWDGSSGRDGSAVYKVDVKALREKADEAIELYHNLTRREATSYPGATLPVNQAPRDQLAGETRREATTNQSIDPSISQEEETDLFSRTYAGDPETQKYAPDYFEHPAFVMYLEAFGFHPDKFRHYQRELFALHVELTEESLEAWNETLNLFKYSSYRPELLHNLFNNYKRRRNGDFNDGPDRGADPRNNGNGAGRNGSGFSPNDPQVQRGENARDELKGVPGFKDNPQAGRRRRKSPESVEEWRREAGYS